MEFTMVPLEVGRCDPIVAVAYQSGIGILPVVKNHVTNAVGYVAKLYKYSFHHASVNRATCFFWGTCFLWKGIPGLTLVTDLGDWLPFTISENFIPVFILLSETTDTVASSFSSTPEFVLLSIGTLSVWVLTWQKPKSTTQSPLLWCTLSF